MIVRNLRHHTTLFRSGNDLLRGCFSSFSIPPKGGSEGVGEKAKETMDNVLGVAKETSKNIKDRVKSGTEDNKTAKPSSNPDLNHGVEPTDSSCEDVRDRPGGYS